jgi:cell division protein FtsX
VSVREQSKTGRLSRVPPREVPGRLRRAVGAAVGVVIACGIVIGSPAAASAGNAVKVPLSKLADAATDAEVFMTVNASPEQIAAVQHAITTSGLVVRYAHLDKLDAYQEFKQIFANQPDLVAAIGPSDLPESFRLDLDRHVTPAQAKARFGHLQGVDRVTWPGAATVPPVIANQATHCEDPIKRIEVYMTVRATPDQVAAVEHWVAAQPGVTTYVHLDKIDALAEFRRIFRKDKRLVASVTAADLPESFRVQVAADHESAVVSAARAFPGVDKVATPDDAGLCGLVAPTTTAR